MFWKYTYSSNLITNWHLRRIDTRSRETTMSKLCYLPSEKGSSLNRGVVGREYQVIILDIFFLFLHEKHLLLVHITTQWAHNVKMTSYQRQCDVITSHRRWYDVILILCACWEAPPRGACNKYSQHMFKLRIRTNYPRIITKYVFFPVRRKEFSKIYL